MRLQDRINKDVEKYTGFDIPALENPKPLSKEDILKELRHQKIWMEDFAQTCNSFIDDIICRYYTIDERLK